MTIINNTIVDWDKDPRLFWIPAAIDDVTVQDYVDTARKKHEYNLMNLSMGDHLVDAAGKEDLGGGVYVGITASNRNVQIAFIPDTTSKSEGTATTANPAGTILIDSAATFQSDGVEAGALIVNLTDKSVAVVYTIDSQIQITHSSLSDGTENDWDVGDVYKIWNTVQKTVKGGNLVAVDENQVTIDAIFPTPFTQVVMTSSSSATLQELEAIQFASYQNGVWIAPVAGQAGTTYPIGTREYPVNNFDDAHTILDNIGLNTLYLLEDITCDGHDLDGHVIIGENYILTTLTLTGGCSTEGTEFKNMTLAGVLDGNVLLERCKLDTVTGFKGEAFHCVLNTSLGLGGTSSDLALLLDCWLGSSTVGGVTTIDMNGDGPVLNVRGHAGAFKITNKTGAAKVAIDFLSGRIILDSTVTNGTFYLRGCAEISENNSTGTTIYDSPLVNMWGINNKFTIDEVNSKLQLWDPAGTTVVKEWPLTDKDLASIVLQGTGPANRGVPVAWP